jgi:hypothetical protein
MGVSKEYLRCLYYPFRIKHEWYHMYVLCGTQDRTNKYHLCLSSMDVVKGEGLTELTLEMDCDKMAMGLSPVISVVFLIAKSFW